eukprot:497396-Pyramimonas_sp.AAC.2
MPRGVQENRRSGKIPNINIPLMVSDLVSLLKSTEDGDPDTMGELLDPQAYKTKSAKQLKYKPCIRSLAATSEVLTKIIQRSGGKDGQVKWDQLRTVFMQVMGECKIKYYKEDPAVVAELLASKYSLMLQDGSGANLLR